MGTLKRGARGPGVKRRHAARKKEISPGTVDSAFEMWTEAALIGFRTRTDGARRDEGKRSCRRLEVAS